ncbi:MAG: hypothetical protein HUJ26_03220 [Planctomycetaceae bacterium]|nr:hypothetical protein [Planctomycetaceae bacterium]
MNSKSHKQNSLLLILCVCVVITLPSCKHHTVIDTGVVRLGDVSDRFWQKQEDNSEASEFIIHEHEFVANTIRLNQGGEDHLKQIAARMIRDQYPIIVERSSMSPSDGKYNYPVANDPQLDMRRREMVIRVLQSMGRPDAEQRVVVAPVYSPGFQVFEAERAYGRGFSGYRGYSGGFGGFSSRAGF